MVVLLVAGIGLLLAGLLAIGYGIPINEFGFGNTLIVAGTVSACAGIIMFGLWIAVRELKNMARGLGPDVSAGLHEDAALMTTIAGVAARAPALATENAGDPEAPASPPPWHEETSSRDRGRSDGPAATESAEAAPTLKPRRNLLFSSSSRKERERAQARTTEPSTTDLGPAAATAPPAGGPGEPPAASFEEAWPKPERPRTVDAPPLPRRERAPSTFAEAGAGAVVADRQPPLARDDEPPAITVLKSGVVDGMAYSLYSDGSIEAQMPEGMMRFASIDELRTHLDQRP